MLYVAYHHTAVVNNNLLVFYLRILLSYLITALKTQEANHSLVTQQRFERRIQQETQNKNQFVPQNEKC